MHHTGLEALVNAIEEQANDITPYAHAQETKG